MRRTTKPDGKNDLFTESLGWGLINEKETSQEETTGTEGRF